MAQPNQQQQPQQQQRPQRGKFDLTTDVLASVKALCNGEGLRQFSDAELQAIYDDMPDGLVPADYKKFVYFCSTNNINPLINEVHAEYKADKSPRGIKMATIVHVDAYRARASEKDLVEWSKPVYGKDDSGKWVEFHIKKRGSAEPFIARVYVDEYLNSAKYNYIAKDIPIRMTTKAAEALCFRQMGIFTGAVSSAENFIEDWGDQTGGGGDDDDGSTRNSQRVGGFAIGVKVEEQKSEPANVQTQTQPAQTPAPPAQQPQKQPDPAPPAPTAPANGQQTTTAAATTEQAPTNGDTPKPAARVQSPIQKKFTARLKGIFKAIPGFKKPMFDQFVLGFHGVDTLPNDPAKYTDVFLALERVMNTESFQKAIVANPGDLGKRLRDTMQEQGLGSFAKYTVADMKKECSWPDDLCALALDVMRTQGWTPKDFFKALVAAKATGDNLTNQDTAVLLRIWAQTDNGPRALEVAKAQDKKLVEIEAYLKAETGSDIEFAYAGDIDAALEKLSGVPA